MRFKEVFVPLSGSCTQRYPKCRQISAIMFPRNERVVKTNTRRPLRSVKKGRYFPCQKVRSTLSPRVSLSSKPSSPSVSLRQVVHWMRSSQALIQPKIRAQRPGRGLGGGVPWSMSFSNSLDGPANGFSVGEQFMKTAVDTPCPSILPVLLTTAEPRPLQHGQCFVESSTPPREVSLRKPSGFPGSLFCPALS